MQERTANNNLIQLRTSSLTHSALWLVSVHLRSIKKITCISEGPDARPCGKERCEGENCVRVWLRRSSLLV